MNTYWMMNYIRKGIVLKERMLGWTVSGLFSIDLMLLLPVGQDSTISLLW